VLNSSYLDFNKRLAPSVKNADLLDLGFSAS